MTYTILFIVALILVSGFIAYFGDLLGRRMGKKRLTLWRLRPRHTAIIVTTITGMLISALVLFTLLAVNTQFRKVLTRGEAIIAQNEHLTTANVNLEKRNVRLQQQREKLAGQVAVLARQVESAKKEVAKAAAVRDKALSDVKRLEALAQEKQRELDKLTRRADLAEGELKKRTAELASVKSDLKDAQEHLAAAQTRLSQAESGLKSAQERLAVAEDNYNDAQAKLVDIESRLRAKEAEVAKQEARLVQLRKITEDAVKEATALRDHGFIFRQGDELARGAINPRQSGFAIKSDLYNLLEQASEKAMEQGAAVADTNGRAVSLIFRQILSNVAVVYQDDEEECVDLAAAAVSRSPYEVLVQAVCAYNALPGEQVKVEFLLYLNKIIYYKGDLIAETKINGRLSEGRVLIELINFLQGDLSRTALKAGLIPVATSISRQPAEQNPDEVDEEMAIVERIKAMNGPARLAVYATDNIHAGDSLNVRNMRFSVTKMEQ